MAGGSSSQAWRVVLPGVLVSSGGDVHGAPRPASWSGLGQSLYSVSGSPVRPRRRRALLPTPFSSFLWFLASFIFPAYHISRSIRHHFLSSRTRIPATSSLSSAALLACSPALRDKPAASSSARLSSCPTAARVTIVSAPLGGPALSGCSGCACHLHHPAFTAHLDATSIRGDGRDRVTPHPSQQPATP